ncbi:MAG: wax ester/triacylglycerol synthase family O-acyltransferase [Candidatus Dormiibacterota bacterium]
MSAAEARVERLSPIDTAWLHMDAPTNLMVVGSICFFDDPLSHADLLTALRRRLLVHSRFTQRIGPSLLGPPRWVPDRDFDLPAHVHRIALPRPGDDAELRTLVSDLMSQPLDMHRPLWDCHLVEGYGAGSALITRIHHAIGDGNALVRVLVGLTAEDREASLRVAPAPVAKPRRDGPGLVLPDPREAPRLLRDAGLRLYALARVVSLWPDPSTPLRGPLTRTKRVAWTQPFPLEQLRPLRRATGCTVNDIVVAALAGALRRNLIRRRAGVPDAIRAIVPVDLRRASQSSELGNSFGMVFLPMPVGLADRLERLQAVHEGMRAERQSALPAVAMEVLGVAGLVPRPVERVLMRFFGSKGTAVVTNVRGPDRELYLAGRVLRRVTFFVPQSAELGLGVSFFSYSGQIETGVIADSELVPDPVRLTREISEELRRLVRAAPAGESG